MTKLITFAQQWKHDGRFGYGGVCVLVGAAVFKTVERQSLSLVGSIPIRLRHLRRQAGRNPVLTVTFFVIFARRMTKNVAVNSVVEVPGVWVGQ